MHLTDSWPLLNQVNLHIRFAFADLHCDTLVFVDTRLFGMLSLSPRLPKGDDALLIQMTKA